MFNVSGFCTSLALPDGSSRYFTRLLFRQFQLNQMPDFRKILIIQTSFIGDVVLATAVVEKLAQYYPQTDIDFLVRKGNESVLANNPHLRQVLVWEKQEQKLKNLRRLILQVRAEEYDLVVNCHRFASSGLVTALSKAKTTVGFAKNPLSRLFTQRFAHIIGEEPYPHEVERNQQLIAAFTDSKPARPRLYPSEEDRERLAQYAQERPFICVAPSSVWRTKKLPQRQWVQFLDELPEELPVLLLGSPDEREYCSEIQEETVHEKVEVLAGKLSLLQSAALMKQAKMNYVHDSAPMHLASAMNAPVTAVYCSTIPEFGFGPLSDVRHVVQHPGELSCRPCGLHGWMSCPQFHFKCAKEIEVQQLMQGLGCV